MPEQRIMANFLDLPINDFLPVGSDFNPFENRYSSKITELTGFPSTTKNFQSDGKTFRDFAEHRLGTSLEGALYLCLKNFTTSGRVVIPSLSDNEADLEQLKGVVSPSDMHGIAEAMEIILNPQLETGSKIIKMNPTIEQEFPNFRTILSQSSVGKTFGDLVYDTVYTNQLSLESVTA